MKIFQSIPAPLCALGFPWLSGPPSGVWRLGAQAGWLGLLASGAMLGGADNALKMLAFLIMVHAALGQLAASKVTHLRRRIWVAGLVIAPPLMVAVGEAEVVYRLILVAYGRAGLTSALGADVLAVLLCWPVIVAAALRTAKG